MRETTTDWREALASFRAAGLGGQISGDFTRLALDAALLDATPIEMVGRYGVRTWVAVLTYDGVETSTRCAHRHETAAAAAKCVRTLVKEAVAAVNDPTFSCDVVGTLDEGTRPVTWWSWGPEVIRKGLRTRVGRSVEL